MRTPVVARLTQMIAFGALIFFGPLTPVLAGTMSGTILQEALKEDFNREGIHEFESWQREVQVAQVIAEAGTHFLSGLSDEKRALISEYLRGNYHNFSGIKDRLNETLTAFNGPKPFNSTDCEGWEIDGDWEHDFRACQKKDPPPGVGGKISELLPFLNKQPGYVTILGKKPKADQSARLLVDNQIGGTSKEQIEFKVCASQSNDGKESIEMCLPLDLEELANKKAVTAEDVLRKNQRKTFVPGTADEYVKANMDLSPVEQLTPPRAQHASVTDRRETEPEATLQTESQNPIATETSTQATGADIGASTAK